MPEGARKEKAPGIPLSKIRGFSHSGVPLGTESAGPTIQQKRGRYTTWSTCFSCGSGAWCLPMSMRVVTVNTRGITSTKPEQIYECAACDDEYYLGGTANPVLPRTTQNDLFIDSVKKEQWF